MHSNITLSQMGWKPFFQQQLTLDDYETCHVARVIAHHRSGYQYQTEQGGGHLKVLSSMPEMTVGDWLLLDDQDRFVRLLERSSQLKRKAAGSKVAEQYIAANIDVLFIVTSLNQDFNLSRIERYLSLTRENHIEPVILLTKKDLCEDWQDKIAETQALDPMLIVEAVNALESDTLTQLSPWCGTGNTVAFVGSSGVGKSTLINCLSGELVQDTGGIREDDSKGRHTTTSRSLHFMPSGAVLIDTPGMRELQLTGHDDGVSETFTDIRHLSQSCRFSDCQHQSEPGCAVQQALENGELDQRRLQSYFKLLREQQRNSETLAEQRARYRQFGKMVKTAQHESRHLKQND